MTVIVYRNGVMAADTGCFSGSVIVGVAEEKIIRLPDGSLLGCAGSKGDIWQFRAWAMEGFQPDKRPKDFDDFGALHVAQDGAITEYGKSCYPYPAPPEWGYQGAGEDFVHGLLVAGLSAERAVELAIQHYAWAAGTVQAMSLTP